MEVNYDGDEYLVWEPEIIKKLRKEHRIVGQLIGSIPTHKSQNLHFSVPLLLTKEEVHLAHKNTWIKIKQATSDSNDNFLEATPNYPNTDEEKQKQIVFEDLHNRGYYITSGVTFGGDYLAYPGDPLDYHSHFIVLVKKWDETFSPLHLVTLGRLGVTVHKSSVFASVNPQTNQPQYVCIDWQGSFHSIFPYVKL